MNLTKQQYADMVDRAVPKSRLLRDCIGAFLTGGAICLIGQGIRDSYLWLGLSEKDTACMTSMTLVFIGVLLTFLGLYDNIAAFAGAGTLVPITGFANAVASPAMEFRCEGWVMGTGAKMFAIAGPVIAYGTAASMLYGLWIVLLSSV